MKTPIACLCVTLLVFSGCDLAYEGLNDAIPEIGVSDGIFGLNGASGAEVSGTFSDAGKTSATARFEVSTAFDDQDAGDFSRLKSITTTIGMALLDGNIGMYVDRGSASALPASISVTGWSLDWTLSDASHTGSNALTTPSGAPIVSSAGVTFTRAAGCAADASSCGYTPSNPSVLISLFPLDITSEGYLDRLSSIVFQTNGVNSANTIDLTLLVSVSNPLSQLVGLSARMRVAEYETQVTPIIF